ncbi:urease subunit beta [Nocardiopsis sp. NPDC007018]|uniref:urease subunit beta n=1 Tax=Nocardiopsis sp. NPDC007018 TaxID=3155721 RepID=UPI0033E994E3
MIIPGEIRTRVTPLDLNADRERLSLVVVNAGDRPIQIGSHLHFPDANPALDFDREVCRGFRLDIPAGTSIRLEPGVSRTVDLVAFGGRRYVPGLQLNDLSKEPKTGERVPRPVIPFGTPGVEVPAPERASGTTMRVGEIDAHDGDPAEVVPTETPPGQRGVTEDEDTEEQQP